MSIKISDSIKVGQQRPLEDKYFNELVPYTSTTQVNTLLVKAVRHIGLTVNINGEEYWYKGGIENENLVLKVPNIDLSTKLDRGRYTGTAEDLNDSINNLERINYVWSTTNRTLTLFDGEGNQLSQVSLVSLDNEGTDLRYNSTSKSLELYNADNQLLDSIPVSDFVGNVGTALQLNSNTLQLKDSQGNVLSSVSFSISNISGLQTALDAKEPTLTAGTSAQYYRGDKTWQVLDKSAVGLSNVDNTSDNNKPISTAQATALDTKLDKTSTTVAAPDDTFKYVYLTDENNNVRRMLAGNSGKNVTNSSNTTTGSWVQTQRVGDTFTWDTQGQPYSIKNLPDKSNDASFIDFVGKNSQGQFSKVGYPALNNLFSSFTQDQALQLAQLLNGGVGNAGMMSVNTISPPLFEKENNNVYVVLRGSNLYLNTQAMAIEIVRASDNAVLAQVPNSQIQLYADGLSLIFYYNFNNLEVGNYKLRITSGTKILITTLQFQIVSQVEHIDLNSIVWNKIVDSSITNDQSTASGAQFSLVNNIHNSNSNSPLISLLTSQLFNQGENWYMEVQVSCGTASLSNAGWVSNIFRLGISYSNVINSLQPNTLHNWGYGKWHSPGSSIGLLTNVNTNSNEIMWQSQDSVGKSFIISITKQGNLLTLTDGRQIGFINLSNNSGYSLSIQLGNIEANSNESPSGIITKAFKIL